MFQKNKLYITFPKYGPILILCCLCLINYSIALERPDSLEVSRLKADNVFQARLDFAKELGNHQIDKVLLQKAINKAQRKYLEFKGLSKEEINTRLPLMAPPPAWQGMPTTGNVKILALLIEFQDETHTNSQNFIHNNLFGSGDPARFPYESLTNYYKRSSYNKLNLDNGNTLGWYQTSYNRTSVVQTTAGRENLLKEVLTHYDNQGHDFSQYDNNGDGSVDYFIVIWAGPDNGWANFWWGYQTSFSDATFTLDNVRFGKYSWQWESRPTGSTFTPVVVIHETGHALGLPDYYDYDDSVGPRGGVGDLDMMDANKGDHNCFSKWVLDWLAPIYIFGGTQTLSLDASGNSEHCVLIWPPTEPDIFSEYFMVQNRHRIANDDAPGMPGDGMLIWHVDATLNSAGTNYKYNNSWTDRKLLRLMEADGLEQIENGFNADANDYFKKGRQFRPCDPPPNSKKYDNSETGIKISDFSDPATTMSAKFEHDAKCEKPFWLNIYNMLTINQSDLKLLREYRDQVLICTEEGKYYKMQIYEYSDELLHVIITNPDLLLSLHNLLDKNMDAIQRSVQGKQATIFNTEEVVDFIDSLAGKSPSALSAYLNKVKGDILKKYKTGQNFVGFKLLNSHDLVLISQ